MTELAAEIADGVLLNWLPVEAVPMALRRLEAGAQRAGRSLADFEIAAYVRTAVTESPEPVRQALAREITGYAVVDSYARFFAATGFAAEVEAVHAAWKAGDRAGAVRQISPRFLDALGVVGSAESCRESLAAFTRAGISMPVVFPFAGGPEAAQAALRTVRALP
jgi:alkanesulfonate monooxygenase SsuD/methylene tetrahydromethanopterin reductase-like flavin-dependent oxidoreductase (luciferase family)